MGDRARLLGTNRGGLRRHLTAPLVPAPATRPDAQRQSWKTSRSAHGRVSIETIDVSGSIIDTDPEESGGRPIDAIRHLVNLHDPFPSPTTRAHDSLTMPTIRCRMPIQSDATNAIDGPWSERRRVTYEGRILDGSSHSPNGALSRRKSRPGHSRRGELKNCTEYTA